MIFDFIFKSAFIQGASKSLQNWSVVVAAFALGLGAVSLLRLHGRNIVRRTPGWVNSAVLLAALLFMTFQGIVFGTKDKWYMFAFDNMLSPLSAAVYASLAFYIASAGYRAFKIGRAHV